MDTNDYPPTPNRSYSVIQDPSSYGTQMFSPLSQAPVEQSALQASQQQFPQTVPFGSWSFEQAPTYSLPPTTRGMITTGDEFAPMKAEETSKLPGPQTSGEYSQSNNEMAIQTSTTQMGYMPFPADAFSSCGPKKPDDIMEFPNFDPDVRDYSQQLSYAEEDGSIIDLRHCQLNSSDINQFSHDAYPRRFSESTHSLSSAGGVFDMTPYEEVPTSEAMSYTSDCDAAWSLEQAVNLLSPGASPRRPPNDPCRAIVRPRPSPLQYPSVRSSPYPMEIGRRTRWSTGGVASSGAPSNCQSVTSMPSAYSYGARLNHPRSLPIHPSSNPPPLRSQSHDTLGHFSLMASGNNAAPLFPPIEPTSPDLTLGFSSHRLFRLLQSNVDSHCGSSHLPHLPDLSDPPDLYASLEEEQSSPPESDMNPSDPEMVPHEQDLRFGGDLYTPRWVRGHGNKREGWCGLCKPGRWLVLKNSAFWYDKSFTHGVSAATGTAFQAPQETRRTEGNPDLWEGLCGSCGEWFALISNKKKGTTWFRHAYKCHTHAKVKDAPRRRRDTIHSVRGRAASSASLSASSMLTSRDGTPQVRIPGRRLSEPVALKDEVSPPASQEPLPNSNSVTPLCGLASMV